MGPAMLGPLRSCPEALRLEDVLDTNGLVQFRLDAAEYPLGREATPLGETEGRRSLAGVLYQSIPYVLMSVVSVLMLFPFVWMISTALRPEGHQAELSLIPQPYLAFENFARAWTYPHTLFNQYAINSLVIAVVSTVLAVSLNALAGFAFAKHNFPGRTVLFYLVLATLMVPFQITMIPTYVTVAKLGLINNYRAGRVARRP
jgi:ABC-type glycerol-3-phosphate transport system permease component